MFRFKVREEKVIGVNPRTREEISFKRKHYIYKDLDIVSNDDEIKTYSEIQLDKYRKVILETCEEAISYPDDLKEETLQDCKRIIDIFNKEELAIEESIYILATVDDLVLNHWADFTSDEEYLVGMIGKELTDLVFEIYKEDEEEID